MAVCKVIISIKLPLAHYAAFHSVSQDAHTVQQIRTKAPMETHAETDGQAEIPCDAPSIGPGSLREIALAKTPNGNASTDS